MLWSKKLWLAVYEGEGGDGNTITPPPAGGTPPAGRTFTQDEVNRMMAENKRTLQKQNSDLVTQLETIKQTATLTQQERDELQTRIDGLQQQYMTKEELAKQEQAKKEKKFKEDFETVASSAKQWETRYSKLFKDQVITSAAAEHGAYSVDQMVGFLAPNTEIVPALGEDGKPTGEFLAVVPMQVVKDGKVETVKMPVPDAVKTMKSMPQKYGNLFKGDGTPGLGLTTASGPASGGKIEFSSNMSDEEYQKWRKQQGIA